MTRSGLLLHASVVFTLSSCGGDHFSSGTSSSRGAAAGRAGASGGRVQSGNGGASSAGAAGGSASSSSGGSTDESGGRGGADAGSGGASAGTTAGGGVSSVGGTPGDGGASSGGSVSSSGGTSTGGTSPGGAGGKGAGGAAMPPPRYCDGQQAALFCEDFDRLTNIDTLLTSWTSVSTTGGTFTLDTGTGMPSPPNALRLRTTSPQDVQALAIHELPRFTKAPSKVRLDFDLRIDAGDTVGLVSGAAIANLLAGSRIADGIIGIEISPGPALYAGYIDQGGNNDELQFSSAWPAEGKWLERFALEITYSVTAAGTKTGCVQAYIGATRQFPQCLRLPASLATPPALMSVALGVLGGGLATTGDIQLRFDNVVVTAQ